MTNLLEQSKAASANIKNMIVGIKQERVTLLSLRETLEKEKHALYLQPLCKADVKEVIIDFIDREAKRYLNSGELKTQVIERIAFPRGDAPNTLPKPHNAAINLYQLDEGVNSDYGFNSLVFGPNSLNIFNGYALSTGNRSGLCFYFGDILKKKIEEHFDDLFPADWDSFKPGLPLIERREKIAEINTKIDSLNVKIKEYDGHLRELQFSAKV